MNVGAAVAAFRTAVTQAGVAAPIAYGLNPFSIADVPDLIATITCGEGGVPSSRFPGKSLAVTASARSALDIALSALDLVPSDNVAIFTTTDNFYISRCVTDTIARHCRWSRQMVPETKAILLNHEFGFPSDAIAKLTGYGLPLIEDCAYSYLSQTTTDDIGVHAEFVICSLPKIYPVPFGGELHYSQSMAAMVKAVMPANDFHTVLGPVIRKLQVDRDAIVERRRENHTQLEELFLEQGVQARMQMRAGDVPGAFMFRLPAPVDQDRFKVAMHAQGIESSVFYGEHSYFIPCHQNLTATDLNYIVQVTSEQLKRSQRDP